MTKKTMTWKSMQSHLNGLQITKKIMEDYLIYGNYEKLGKAYDTSKLNLKEHMIKWRNLGKKAYPKLYAAFESRVEQNINKSNADEYIESSMFQDIPKQIKYCEFIDKMCQIDTKAATINQLLEIAAKNGIKVIN